MRLAAIVLWALIAAQTALAQSFLDPTATSAQPGDMRVEWERVGHETQTAHGFIEQWIRCVVTDSRAVIDERRYPIRWREGTPREEQERLCQQMADDYLRYVIGENVRPRESFDAMLGEIDGEIRTAWDSFVVAVQALHEPVELPVVAMLWRGAFERIEWLRQDTFALEMARAAGCGSVDEFFARVIEYREWL